MSEYSLISEGDLLTVSGLIFATSIITNGLSYLTNLAPKYVGFVISICVYFAVNWQQFNLSGAGAIVFLSNVFIIYSGAVGTSAMLANSTPKTRNGGATAPTDDKGPEELRDLGKGRFFERWW